MQGQKQVVLGTRLSHHYQRIQHLLLGLLLRCSHQFPRYRVDQKSPSRPVVQDYPPHPPVHQPLLVHQHRLFRPGRQVKAQQKSLCSQKLRDYPHYLEFLAAQQFLASQKVRLLLRFR